MGERIKQFEILLIKADEDLSVAEFLYHEFNKGHIELKLEVILFHLQQACEKNLKAILDFFAVKYPKTHDLTNLIYLLDKNNISFSEKHSELIEDLNDYAVEGRYSIIHDDIENLDEFLNVSKILAKFAKNKIKKLN